MLAVLVLSTVGLVFVAMGQRYVSATLCGEENLLAREDFREGGIEAMAVAIEKLERRAPSTSSYECSLTLTTTVGVRTFAIEYKLVGGSDWEINVAPYSGTSLPAMPNLLP